MLVLHIKSPTKKVTPDRTHESGLQHPQRRPVIFHVKLYALPRVDAVRALRSALKTLLRRHGLRVLSIEIEDGKQGGRAP
jgi:hypothetical protein